MDGITNCWYRTITKELFKKNNSAQDREFWLWTEFMNVEWFVREPGKLIHHMIKTDFEDKTIAQIYGAEPDALVESAKFIDQGIVDMDWNRQFFAGVELNIGCPSPKVMSCGWWAGMMRDREGTLEIIKNIVKNTTLPFSIKTRTWLTQFDRQLQKEFILDAAPYCKRIIIHGRTYKQSHSGQVDRDFISEIKKELGDSCVVIGNWWIRSYEQVNQILNEGYTPVISTDALVSNDIQSEPGSILQHESQTDWQPATNEQNHIDTTILDGVMIGQWALWRPWIFTGTQPTLEERYNTIVRHAQMMIILYEYYFTRVDHWRDLILPTYEWLNNEIRIFDASKYEHEKTLIEYRKYIFNYISGLPWNRDLKVQLAHTKKYEEMIDFVDAFFEKIGKEQTNDTINIAAE